MPVTLWPDQEIWVAGLSNAFGRGHRRVLGRAETGFGKTVCFCNICRRAALRGNRVVLIGHRIEIVQQIGAALRRENVPHGYIAPSFPETNDAVQVAMVQSLVRRIDRLQEPSLLVIDEAHHATAGAYKAIADRWSNARILGVTASPARTDGRGLGECFEVMVEGPPMRELISRGRLSNFRIFAPPVVADLSNLHTRAGDFAQDELAMAMDRSAVTGDAVRHYAKHLDGRPAIAFCTSVAHAQHVAEQFSAAGWKAASVDGNMSLAERRDRIAAIGDGRLNVLTSCDVISEGTDIPVVAGAILLRPTQSLIVFLQQIGRVLRVKPGGGDAIILDHVNNTSRMGMPDAAREWTLEGRAKRNSPPPVRQCMQCYAAFSPAPRCPSCGFVFPVKSTPRRIEQQDGELTQVDEVAIQRIKKEQISAMVRGCADLKQMQELAHRLGFKPGWAWMQWSLRQRLRRRRAA